MHESEATPAPEVKRKPNWFRVFPLMAVLALLVWRFWSLTEHINRVSMGLIVLCFPVYLLMLRDAWRGKTRD